jgi:hypothetical protein
MTKLIFSMTGRDRRPATAGLGLPRLEPTPLEIQRWEDDGGAILPDRAKRRRVECEEDLPHLERSAA